MTEAEEKVKRPAFQFYPADWRKDVELQSCSMGAQGLWINMMCLAHQCTPYGHLTVNGKAMNPAQLGRQVGLSARECESLLLELEDAGVVRRTDQGVLFSKRMVDDEAVREARAAGGHAGAEHGKKGAKDGSKGGRPKDSKGGLETPLTGSEEPPPSSSSSSSSSPSVKGDTPLKPPAWTPPDWLPAEQWADFVKHRKAMRGVPFTDAARDGVIREVAKFRGMGYDPAQLLETAVVRGWRTVFEPKGDQRTGGAAGSPYQQARTARMAEAVPGLVGAPNSLNVFDTEARDVTAIALG